MVTSGPLAGPPSKARPGKVLGACGGGAPAPQRCLTLHPHHRAPVSGGGRRDCAPPVAPSGPRREPAVDSAVASTPCLVGLGQAPSNRTAGQPPGNGPEIRTGPGHRHRHLLPRRAPRPRQMMAPPEPRRGSIQRLAALPGSVCARRSGVHRSEGRDARDLTAGPDPSSAGRRAGLLFGLLVVMVGAAATPTRPAVGVIISLTGFLVMLAAAGRLMAVTAQRPGPSGSAHPHR